MASVLIKGGHIINPATEMNIISDMFIEDGKVKRIAEDINAAADVVIDADGLDVMPGFVDMHVHFREPGFEYKETIKTGSLAAAAGGYTTVCPMPNTKPVIDCAEMVNFIKEKSESDSIINIIPVGSMTKAQAGEEVSDIHGMKKAGAGALSEDGKSVMCTPVLYEALKAAVAENLIFLDHCEDKSLVRGGVMNEGRKSKELGLAGITDSVEDTITARDIIMCNETGVRLHICHCSTKIAADLVRYAKSRGMKVTAEVTPHHFTLTDDDIPSDDGNYKMNPPLRSKDDVMEMLRGLKDGTIDCISTDHAPHSADEKNVSMNKAAFGIVGLETAYSLSQTALVNTGILTSDELVCKMSLNPSRILGIDRGDISVGKAADIAIADPGQGYEINPCEFRSKGHSTPFAGKYVMGRVLMTLVNGNIVFKRQ
jgi:dihydroorotase